MSTVVVRYKVKPEFVSKNTQLVKAVFGELQENEAKGLRYAVFLADDGATFFHIATVVDGATNPLFECSAFKAFQNDISDRCEESPVLMQVAEVDSFNFFG